MIFKCRNCGGNVIYSPEKHAMFCPYCDSEESQEVQNSSMGDIRLCPDCGGEIPVLPHTSALQCPYCSNYIILNERVEGVFLPKMLIPFQMGKEACKQMLREKFKKHVFAPTDFLSEARLNSMEGTYVPFWFYDYDVNADYQGEGTKVRTWTSGNTQYTETSYYDVRRNMDVNFQSIPVDASEMMPDDIMDLMEPYAYGQLQNFEPKYLSGFHAEKYNMESSVVEDRAKKKMLDATIQMMKEECSGYNSLRQTKQDIAVRDAKQYYGLLPVWKYMYRYQNTDYPFYVNGQTGKIVGTVPISKGKVVAYACTLWGCLTILCTCAVMMSVFALL